MIIIWIIVAIIIFSLVILIHELWHFLAARFFGVKVLEFWLWIPPKAKELFTDKYWTKYTLNWLPLWGFVRLNWENPHLTSPEGDEEENSPLLQERARVRSNKFYNKNYLEKTIILLAWVFMNFLLASVIFSVLFFIWIKPLWINDKIPTNLESKIIPTYREAIKSGVLIKKKWLIVEPIENSLAKKSWLQKWDIILKINNIKISDYKNFKKELENNKNKTINLELKNNKKIKINLDNKWKIWAYIWENIEINKNFKYKYSLMDSIKYWFKETYIQSFLTIKWLNILINKLFSPKNDNERQEAIKQMSWPIWIVDFVSHSLWAWIIFLSIITAIISINLWIFNLLPIPALDWWRWFLLSINTLIKKIFWNKIWTDNFENSIHIFFFIILIALSIVIWYNDIEKIINR
jgi:regulator of sigma E protease